MKYWQTWGLCVASFGVGQMSAVLGEFTRWYSPIPSIAIGLLVASVSTWRKYFTVTAVSRKETT